MRWAIPVSAMLLIGCGFTPRDSEGRVCYTEEERLNEDWDEVVCDWRARCDNWPSGPMTAAECRQGGGGAAGFDFRARIDSCWDGCLFPACMEAMTTEPCIDDYWQYPACLEIAYAQDANECTLDVCGSDSYELCWERQAEDLEALRAAR